MKLWAGALLIFVLPCWAAGQTQAQATFRIELRGQSAILSKDQPVQRGSLLVFHRYPDGVLTSVPQEQVLRVVEAKPAAPPKTPAPAATPVPTPSEKSPPPAAAAAPAVTAAPGQAQATSPAASSPAPAAGPEPPPSPVAGKPPVVGPASYVPPRVVQSRISLSEAARLTLENDPNLLFARQRALELEGAAREASGAFDPLVTFQPSYSHQEGRVIGIVLNREVNRRNVHRVIADQFEQVANDLQRKLDEGGGRVFPDCGGTDIRVDGKSICTSLIDQARALAFDKLLQTLIANEPDPAKRQQYEQIRSSLNDPLRAALVRFVQTLRSVVSSERDALAKLGELPKFEVRDRLDFDLRVHVPFRNGLTIAPVFFLEGVKDNFRSKPLDPIFGGLGVPNLFTAAAGFTADASLAKGGGTLSVTAPERAAKFNFQAGLDTYAQAGSLAVLRTVLAYWDLIAAQDRLELLRKSLAAQQRITEISRALIEGDELARIELSRVQARTADAAAAVAQAQQTVTTGRVSLAKAIGLSLEDLDNAPLASDPLPEIEGVGSLDSVRTAKLATDAVESRSDVKAAREVQEAADVLLRAARYDLKPRVDLSLQFAYNAIHESLRTDYWEPLGFARALGGHWIGPSFEIAVRLQLPIANNVARGRLEQSLALSSRSRIAEKDLERIVRSNTVQFAESVRKVAAEVAERRRSVAYYDETIQATIERFRGGEASLLDTILTERSVTAALLDLVSAKQAFASRMTRLRFETGSLLQHAQEGSRVIFGGIQPVGFSFSR